MICERKGKFWNGCKFQPRYDEELPLPNGVKFTIPPYEDMAAVLITMRSAIYVCDVCVTCGCKIKRTDAAPQPAKEVK